MAGYSGSTSFFDTAPGGSIANLTPLSVGAGDLAIVFLGTTGQAVAGTVADDAAGGGYTLIGSALRTTSADDCAAYVRNNLFASSVGVTFTGTIGANSGAFIAVIVISGMYRAGSSAIRSLAGVPQFVKEENVTTGFPTLSYPAAPLAANPQLTCLNTNANPPNGGMVAGWTQRLNSGYNTPTTGFEVFTINSGGTAITVPWQSGGGNAYCDMAFELDASPDPVAAAASTPFPPLGRGATW